MHCDAAVGLYKGFGSELPVSSVCLSLTISLSLAVCVCVSNTHPVCLSLAIHSFQINCLSVDGWSTEEGREGDKK